MPLKVTVIDTTWSSEISASNLRVVCVVWSSLINFIPRCTKIIFLSKLRITYMYILRLAFFL